VSESALTAGIFAVFGFALGGLLVDGANSILGLVAVLTALATAAAREGAILAGKDETATRRITAIGFFSGAVASALIVLVDALSG